jgi:hypothetical protein
MERNLPGRNELGLVRGGNATISGDGRVVWLLQTDGRLTRVKLDSGERESMKIEVCFQREIYLIGQVS